MKYPRAIGLAVVFCVASSAAALANPRPSPYSYPYATLPDGDLEVEQYVDATPVRVEREDPDGTRAVTSIRFDLQTELEYGLTDRLEVAWYFVFRQGPSGQTPFLRFQGVKQRARYRFAEAGQWPVDLGVYVEAAQFHDEVELEQKLLASRRFGALTTVVNLWVEQEYYFQDEDWKLVYNPTAAASYELSPKVMVGAEYWARGRFDTETSDLDGTGLGNRTRHYLGPTLLVQEGEYFLSLGAYARLDNLADSMAIGDSFGRVWVRAMFGIGL